MRPLLFLADAFINTFGITQPTPKARVRMAWFIFAMLVSVIVLVATAAAVIMHVSLHF
ncbi:MAG TPA: hypothetical protein VFE38_11675 [Edaphobacter sp.]|nr:hypothetical protein [Edaphobacter sp.]